VLSLIGLEVSISFRLLYFSARDSLDYWVGFVKFLIEMDSNCRAFGV
jgi:hypothetical protein